MRKPTVNSAGLVLALALALAGCGQTAEETVEQTEDAARRAAERTEEVARGAATSVATGAENLTRLRATLTGATEVPGPGDPDATGTAVVNIDATKREVCYEVAVQKIDRPTGMHIHEGGAGKAGDIVVRLTTPTASDITTAGCTPVDSALVGRMTANANNFYVNVHTDTYPQGAARGQLSQ